MISDLKAEFLLLHYSNIDFLINRAEIQGSFYIDYFHKIKSKCKYFTGITHYNNENILSADFQYYLNETFKFNEKSDYPIAIIFNIDKPALYKSIIKKCFGQNSRPNLSSSLIGLIINNDFELEKIQLHEIKLLPESIRNKNNEDGILGVRFLENKKNQYYIDIEKTIERIIFRG